MKYFSFILLIIIIASYSVFCSACTSKKSSISVKYESKVSKVKTAKRVVPASVIDLSDGQQVNFHQHVGPTDISEPNFRIINIASP